MDFFIPVLTTLSTYKMNKISHVLIVFKHSDSYFFTAISKSQYPKSKQSVIRLVFTKFSSVLVNDSMLHHLYVYIYSYMDGILPIWRKTLNNHSISAFCVLHIIALAWQTWNTKGLGGHLHLCPLVRFI